MIKILPTAETVETKTVQRNQGCTLSYRQHKWW